MGIPSLTLVEPRDMEHLVRQLQDVLRQIREEFRRQETNAVQRGSRIQAARPIEPSDVVRLVDLREAIQQTNLNVSSLSTGGAAAPPVSTGVTLAAHVGFVEPTDGVRVLFTPELTPALDDAGRPLAILVHRGGYIHFSPTDPPPVGCWTWTGTQVRLPEADVPIAGAILHFALMVLA